jgi:hypothetical protein
LLAGCGLADSRSPVPEFMRIKAAEPPPPEPPPDVGQLVHEKLGMIRKWIPVFPRDKREVLPGDHAQIKDDAKGLIQPS